MNSKVYFIFDLEWDIIRAVFTSKREASEQFMILVDVENPGDWINTDLILYEGLVNKTNIRGKYGVDISTELDYGHGCGLTDKGKDIETDLIKGKRTTCDCAQTIYMLCGKYSTGEPTIHGAFLNIKTAEEAKKRVSEEIKLDIEEFCCGVVLSIDIEYCPPIMS